LPSVIPILLTVVFAAVGFGDAYWKYQQLSAATSEGARTAIVSRSSATRDADITAATKNAAPDLVPANITVTITSSWTPGQTVTVKGSYPLKIDVMGVNFFNGNLQNSRTMRVEQ